MFRRKKKRQQDYIQSHVNEEVDDLREYPGEDDDAPPPDVQGIDLDDIDLGNVDIKKILSGLGIPDNQLGDINVKVVDLRGQGEPRNKTEMCHASVDPVPSEMFENRLQDTQGGREYCCNDVNEETVTE